MMMMMMRDYACKDQVVKKGGDLSVFRIYYFHAKTISVLNGFVIDGENGFISYCCAYNVFNG